jgi:signal transduction histidine kinase
MQYVTVEGQEAFISAFIDITERAQAERQIRTLAAQLTVAEQEERQRISQLLHDDLQQRLYAVHVQLSILSDALRTDDPQLLLEEMGYLEKELAETIRITRDLSIDLSPPVLKVNGLVQAVSWLAAQMHEKYGLEVEIEADKQFPDFDDHLRVLLFQAVRELLFNVVKHAGVAHARVRLEKSDHHLHISVIDDGNGFDTGPLLAGSHDKTQGLSNIRTRLVLLGCQMKFNSSPGKGARIMINIPF